MKRLACALVCSTIVFAACGGDDDETAESVPPAAADTTIESAAETTTAPAPTDPATTAAPETSTPVETDAPAAAAVEVTLNEFSVTMPTTLTAGTVEFAVTNAGQFPHEMLVYSDATFDALPKLDTGAIDESAATGQLVGLVDKLEGGTSGTASFDLAAGNYVFVCNLGNGPNSHAAKGQHIDVRVT